MPCHLIPRLLRTRNYAPSEVSCRLARRPLVISPPPIRVERPNSSGSVPSRWAHKTLFLTASLSAVSRDERDGSDLADAAHRRQDLPALDAPELLADVAGGVVSVNGLR